MRRGRKLHLRLFLGVKGGDAVWIGKYHPHPLASRKGT